MQCFRLVISHLADQGVAAYPFELKLVVHKRDEFVSNLATELREGRYSPESAPVAEMPKGGGGIRPIHLLSFRDQVAFAVLGLICLPSIAAEVDRGHPVAFSHQIRKPIQESKWFYRYIDGWRKFASVSLQHIANGNSAIVETDISGFYENIDHAKLFSELRRIRVQGHIIEMLRICFNKWIPVRRGLPQANMSSALLAKLYLHGIDQHLSTAGFTYTRYADDIRLFCKSKVEAKKALQTLIRVLREVTLTIQTAKTNFYDAETADRKFRGVSPLIDRIKATYEASNARDHALATAIDAEYMSLAELMRDASESAEFPLEVIVDAYQEHIAGKFGNAFDKSVFHFLISRFAVVGNKFAVDDCLTRFVEQPQETRFILRYFIRVGLTPTHEDALLNFVEHDENVYEYQTFEILQYLSHAKLFDNVRIQSIARRFAFGGGPLYLRSQARYLLWRLGSNTDVEAMMRNYANAEGALERAELICAISKMEVGARNTFYGTIEKNPWIVGAAIDWAKMPSVGAEAVVASGGGVAAEPI